MTNENTIAPRVQLLADGRTVTLDLPASSQTVGATDMDGCLWHLARLRSAMMPAVPTAPVFRGEAPLGLAVYCEAATFSDHPDRFFFGIRHPGYNWVWAMATRTELEDLAKAILALLERTPLVVRERAN